MTAMSWDSQIKRLLPSSLLGRSLLIIIMPLILLQVISATIFYERHWDNVARRLAQGVAGDVGVVVEALRESNTSESRGVIFTSAARNMDLTASYRDAAILPSTALAQGAVADEVLARALTDRIQRPFAIEIIDLDGDVGIHVQMTDGILDVVVPRKRLYSSTTYIFVLWMVGSSLILFAVAMVFMRNQVRPIRRLAAAADALGKGRDIPKFKLQGATEVRQAATAFNIMRERLLRQISQRTEMLAGVSHDLRTPLTRMKLQLALMQETPELTDLMGDIREMEEMVDGYLAFARGEGSEEPVSTDLGALLTEVIGGAQRAGGDVKLATDGALTVPVRPAALRRCLANLVGNAMRYGKHVAVNATRRGNAVVITVDDDGPGIPVNQRDEVFRPFRRLEESRNMETGGVGLGLTIARDVIHGHGGAIYLEDSPMGGLRARLHLPV